MNFVALENKGKKILARFPKTRRFLKRVYQRVMFVISRKKIEVDRDMFRVFPDDFEYFFGYYDKSPWDASDRYILGLKVRNACVVPDSIEEADIVVFDSLNNKIFSIAKTHSWNTQQACMAQWLGPDFATRIIYNDFRYGRYCSVIYNFEKRLEEKVLDMPVYDVAKDGSFALTLDFSRLHRLRKGYGYANILEKTRNELCPDSTCIWKIDLKTGEISDILKYTDFASFETRKEMIEAEHKVNHIMISPNGKRFMVLHRWFLHNEKFTRLVTVNIDGTNMYNLSDDNFVSHCYWKNDKEILSFLRKEELGEHYYLLKDKSSSYQLLWPRLNTDGHCSYSPDKSLVVTDSYPNRKRMAYVYLCQEEQEQPVRIASVFAPFKYDNDVRCDLHPRWNHKGNKVCIDSVHEGKKAMYVISIKDKDIPPVLSIKPKLIKGKYKIVYVITNCKNSGPMNQTLNIIKNLDRKLYEPILITLFPEDLGNSVIHRYLEIIPETYCLNMSKISSLLSGKKKLKELLEDIHPDIIHGLGMPPYTLSLAYADAIHLVTLRNYCYQDYPDKYGKFLGFVLARKDMRLIQKRKKQGETFVTCSKSLSDIYANNHHMQFSFIRNGVDLDKYEIASEKTKSLIKKKLGLPLDKTIIVYSGQMNDRKDQQFAIEGVLHSKYVNDILFLLMGDGPNLKSLQTKYAKFDNIVFTGNISNVCEYLQAGDIYVSTSKSEGMPNGVLEAMATGLPSLLSNIPQHLEILNIDDKIGLSYVIGNMDDFISKLDFMLEEDLKEYSKVASKVAKNDLSAKKMSLHYQQLYSSLLKKAKDSYK